MIAGFGGVLRAHVDTPDEICVALREGYVQSHWAPADQGSLMLYARGACFSPATGWMYSSVPQGFSHDSRVSFGSADIDAPFGFVDNNIEDHGFLPSVGYLYGRQAFKKKWDKTGTFPGDFDWSRQVMLLRSEQATGPNLRGDARQYAGRGAEELVAPVVDGKGRGYCNHPRRRERDRQ